MLAQRNAVLNTPPAEERNTLVLDRWLDRLIATNVGLE
jgi:hypothetical protein